MNSLNDKVCEYNLEPVTENFRTCDEAGGSYVAPWRCSSRCGRFIGWDWQCIDP